MSDMHHGSNRWYEFVLFTQSIYAQLEYVRGNYTTCIEKVDSLLKQSDIKGNANRRESKGPLVELLEHKLYSLIDLELYEDADTILKQILPMLEPPQLYTKQIREIYYRCSQIRYHLGLYEKSIYIATGAIGMNRYYENVYKYIILSHIALGQLDQACQLQFEATRYESVWDPEVKARNQEYLLELEHMRDSRDDIDIDTATDIVIDIDSSTDIVIDTDSSTDIVIDTDNVADIVTDTDMDADTGNGTDTDAGISTDMQ